MRRITNDSEGAVTDEAVEVLRQKVRQLIRAEVMRPKSLLESLPNILLSVVIAMFFLKVFSWIRTNLWAVLIDNQSRGNYYLRAARIISYTHEVEIKSNIIFETPRNCYRPSLRLAVKLNF